jgi:hypothetical protein
MRLSLSELIGITLSEFLAYLASAKIGLVDPYLVIVGCWPIHTRKGVAVVVFYRTVRTPTFSRCAPEALKSSRLLLLCSLLSNNRKWISGEFSQFRVPFLG